MERKHTYSARVTWTGNSGTGTSAYQAYTRDHIISVEGKPDIPGSSDPIFLGNNTRYSPEDSLVAALAACHMLWYLHLCAVNNVVVESYVDRVTGVMLENADGSGQFSEVTLHPTITVKEKGMMDKAMNLHKDAHYMCFLARSVNFTIHHKPQILVS